MESAQEGDASKTLAALRMAIKMWIVELRSVTAAGIGVRFSSVG